MATKLFLRSTQNNGIGATYYDMVVAAGAAADTAVVNTAASGTEIQWTKTAGGAVAQWISGRVPAGGFTLTSTDISIWAAESNAQANAGGRFRVFKRAANGVETELGGGPFNDGVEFGTANTEMLWVGNVTDTAFAEDDRILLKLYITNIGTMGSGRTCTLTFNAADGQTGDSFFNIAETVTFKGETAALSGTAALGLTPVGALKGDAALSGAASLGISPAAALLAVTSLAGAATLAFAPAAALQGAGALSGSSSLTVAPAAAMAGAAAMSGQSALALSGAGNISGAAALSAAASAAFSPLGGLAGSSSLSGVATASFSPAANLTTEGGNAVDLSGSAALVFDASAVLKVDASLAGSALLNFTPSGSTVGSLSMAGACALTITGTSGLTADRPRRQRSPRRPPQQQGSIRHANSGHNATRGRTAYPRRGQSGPQSRR
jgi:hypothetical protein